jgi:hypothetical protein
MRRASEAHLHPDPKEPHPLNFNPGKEWVNQNTYVDMESLGPVIDAAFQSVNILPVPAERRRAEGKGRQMESRTRRWPRGLWRA